MEAATSFVIWNYKWDLRKAGCCLMFDLGVPGLSMEGENLH